MTGCRSAALLRTVVDQTPVPVEYEQFRYANDGFSDRDGKEIIVTIGIGRECIGQTPFFLLYFICEQYDPDTIRKHTSRRNGGFEGEHPILRRDPSPRRRNRKHVVLKYPAGIGQFGFRVDGELERTCRR